MGLMFDLLHSITIYLLPPECERSPPLAAYSLLGGDCLVPCWEVLWCECSPPFTWASRDGRLCVSAISIIRAGI